MLIDFSQGRELRFHKPDMAAFGAVFLCVPLLPRVPWRSQKDNRREPLSPVQGPVGGPQTGAVREPATGPPKRFMEGEVADSSRVIPKGGPS